eukprot:s2447_g7.t1
MFSKHSVSPAEASSRANRDAPRRFRDNVGDLFLSGAVPAKRARAIFEDADASGAAGVADLAGVGDTSHVHRDLLRKLKKGKKWKAATEFTIPLWNKKQCMPGEGKVKIMLPHAIVHNVAQWNKDYAEFFSLDNLRRECGDHMNAATTELGLTGENVLPLALWLDGVPVKYDRSESLEVVTLSFPHLSGDIGTLRLPVAALYKSHMVKDGSTMDAIMKVSSSAEDCCDQTCAAVNCSVPGWTQNESKALLVGNTVEECCAPLCGNGAQVVCPAGTAVKPEDVNKTSDGGVEGCCQKQCKSHVCSDGWTRNISKADDFADSDEACCEKTCKQFECPVEDGWTASTSVANDIGDNVTQCCKATCKRFTCNATEGWLSAPGNAKDDIVGDDSSTCCVAACSDYTCSPAKNLMLVLDAAKIPGADDEVCCESSKCDKVRKHMTKLGEEEHCNDLAEDACETKFLKHTSSSEVKASKGKVKKIESTSIVSCRWDSRYAMPETVDFLCSNQLPRASGRDETWAFGTPGVGFGPVGSVSVSHPLLDQALRPGEYGWGGMAGTAWTNDPQEDFVLLSFSLVAFDLSTEEVLRAGVRKAISEFQKEAAQRRLCWLRRCRRYQSLIRTRRYGAECVKRRLCSRHEGFRAPHS